MGSDPCTVSYCQVFAASDMFILYSNTTAPVSDPRMAEEENELSVHHIGQFVSQLSRQEMDDAIEHITGRVTQGELVALLPPGQVIQVIKGMQETGDTQEVHAEKWGTVCSVLDSFDRGALDIFLEEVEVKIELGLNLAALPETCDSCGECFSSVEALVSHIEQDHEEEVLDCPQCGDQLHGVPMAEHMANMHKHRLMPTRVKLELSHECTLCDQTFVSTLAVKRHVKKVHRQAEAKVECTECSALVTDLNTHMKSHQEKKFACNDCPKKYRTNFDLKTHMKSVHLKVLDTCPHCGRQTANLKKHIYGNHTNDFPCDLCGRHFARQTQLNYHMKAHERGTIVEKAGPDVQKERKRVANQKYLEKRKVRKEMDADLHEHEKNLKRIWARKNRDKLMKYKKEYYEKKRTMKSHLEENLILDVETLTQ